MNQPDDIQTGDERRLIEQYRAAADEVPPPALDRAILELARKVAAEQAANAQNAPVFAADARDAPRMRRDEQRWMRPLALAATVVLGIGIVTRVQMESPDLKPPEAASEVAKAPAAPAPASAPAPAATSPEPAAPARQNADAQIRQAPAADANVAAAPPAQPPATPPLAARSPRASDAAPAAAAKDLAEAKPAGPAADARQRKEAFATAQPRADAPSRSAPAPVVRESERRLQDQASAELQKLQAPKQESAAPGAAGGLASAGPAAAPPVAAAAPMAADKSAGATAASRAAVPSPAPPPAPAMAPPPPPPPAKPAEISGTMGATRAPEAAAKRDQGSDTAGVRSADITPFYEGEPDLWARRIADWRRSGQIARADAELKRFRARYPAFKLPPEALPPQ